MIDRVPEETDEFVDLLRSAHAVNVPEILVESVGNAVREARRRGRLTQTSRRSVNLKRLSAAALPIAAVVAAGMLVNGGIGSLGPSNSLGSMAGMVPAMTNRQSVVVLSSVHRRGKQIHVKYQVLRRVPVHFPRVRRNHGPAFKNHIVTTGNDAANSFAAISAGHELTPTACARSTPRAATLRSACFVLERKSALHSPIIFVSSAQRPDVANRKAAPDSGLVNIPGSKTGIRSTFGLLPVGLTDYGCGEGGSSLCWIESVGKAKPHGSYVRQVARSLHTVPLGYTRVTVKAMSSPFHYDKAAYSAEPQVPTERKVNVGQALRLVRDIDEAHGATRVPACQKSPEYSRYRVRLTYPGDQHLLIRASISDCRIMLTLPWGVREVVALGDTRLARDIRRITERG